MNETSSLKLMVHHLRFTLQAKTAVRLGVQAGAQLRGALWQAFESLVCPDRRVREQVDHQAHCPACRLFAFETATGARGINPPRPFAIQPPLASKPDYEHLYQIGETFTLGVSLFGDNADVFPYLCQAVHRMGKVGIGYGRGEFALQQVHAFNPLTREEQPLLNGLRVTALPSIPVTGEVTSQIAISLSTNEVKLHFLTPAQLTGHDRQFQHEPDFATLIARLLERCQAMETHYTVAPQSTEVWRNRFQALTALAAEIERVESRVRWIVAYSSSQRTQYTHDVSGFAGTVVFRGDLTPFREWLLWGQSLHIGKNTVKGNGWYCLEH
jgi:hypothetical protein